jgi:hypothetical protein
MIELRQTEDPYVGKWTYGNGVKGRFGGAYRSGTAGLHHWEQDGDKQILVRRVIKCRSYRRAVRVLRWHLMGYKV